MVWHHENYRIMHKGVTQFNKCTRSVKHILSHHICMPGLIRTSYEHVISFSEMLYPCLSLDIVVVSICNRGAAGVHISWISKRALCGTEDIVLEWISCSFRVSFLAGFFFFVLNLCHFCWWTPSTAPAEENWSTFQIVVYQRADGDSLGLTWYRDSASGQG